ncbi:glutamine--tRNA ligase-like protein [Tanacetum coccineum]
MPFPRRFLSVSGIPRVSKPFLREAVTNGCHRSTGKLLYKVATNFPANALVHRPMLLQYILSSKIKTPAQLDDSFAFLNLTGSENLLDINKFEQACGVGYTMSITPTLEINGEKNQWNIKVKITSLRNQYFTNNNQSRQSQIDTILMNEHVP